MRLRSRALNAYRSIALVLLNTCLLLIVLEIVAGWVYESKRVEGRAQLSYYQNVEWGPALWQEFAQIDNSRQSYYPYTIWRRNAFEGEFFNIGADQLRVTPGAVCDRDDAYVVFAFGGSTMWGTGAPDSQTIPAYLQQGLDEVLEQPVCVVNFGETAYISTQEVITLMLQLQRGNVPDMAIFYNGANDVGNGHVNHQPTLHDNLNNIEDRFRESLLVEALKRTNIARVLANSLAGSAAETAPANEGRHYALGVEAETIAESIALTYLNNYRLVEAMAGEFGFDFYFFWQPIMVVGNKPLTAEEISIAGRDLQAEWTPTYQQAYAYMEQAAVDHERLFYLGNVFDDQPQSIWIDFVHMNPEGNRLVADAILQQLDKQASS